MSPPVVLFVPGSYSFVSDYKEVFDAVAKAGVEMKGVTLPTVGPSKQTGRNEPAPSMYDDAKVIAQAVQNAADEGRDVILAGHSYAGVPMSQSTAGLGKKERAAGDKPGGIVLLAYIAALVPALGQSAGSLIAGASPEGNAPPTSIDDYGWMQITDAEAFAPIVGSDLPLAKGKAVVEGFAKHSAQSFGNELTYAGYKDIPSAWLLCESDKAGPPPFQRQMIEQIEEAAGGRKVAVTSVDSGHMVNFSKPVELAEWIVSLANQTY